MAGSTRFDRLAAEHLALPVDADPAVADLVEEADELEPLVPHLRRLLVWATAPRQVSVARR